MKKFEDFLNEKSTYEYAYNCTAPNDLKELEFIVDNMEDVSKEDFLKIISLEQINRALMYGIKYNTKEQFLKDWGINCYKIKKNEIDAYILVNSMIEYIFKKS